MPYKFEKDEEIKTIARECEECYQRQPLAEDLDVFFSFDRYEDAAKKAAEVGKLFGASGTRKTIRQFLRQAQEFAPARTDFGSVLPVAEHAAYHWESNGELAAFTHSALGLQTEGLEFAFAVSMLSRRLRDLRESNRSDALKSELQSAVQATSAPEAKAKLLLSLYLPSASAAYWRSDRHGFRLRNSGNARHCKSSEAVEPMPDPRWDAPHKLEQGEVHL